MNDSKPIAEVPRAAIAATVIKLRQSESNPMVSFSDIEPERDLMMNPERKGTAFLHAFMRWGEEWKSLQRRLPSRANPTESK